MRLYIYTLMSVVLMTATAARAVDTATYSSVLQVAADIASGADRHDWKRVRAAMAGQITTDYTSLFGGKPATQSADTLIKGWKQFLPGFDSTHHMVTSLMVTSVTEGTAEAQANFTATHRIDKSLWVLGGRYDYKLIRVGGSWRLSALTMTALWETGDRGLVQQAATRAAAKK